MNAVKELIQSLNGAIDLEHRVTEYYKRAADEARNRDITLAHRLYAIEENHQVHVERLEAHRDHLKRQDGNHFWSDTLTSFSEALSDAIAGLPRDFIEGETFPTFGTLARCEDQLINYYQGLRASANAETAVLLDAIVADCNDNIATLQRMDSLQ
jgi:hypothetical protein